MDEEIRPFGMEEYPRTKENDKFELFKYICDDMLETYKTKNADYGDSFAKLFKKYGMTYPIIHMQEKLNRIEALQAKGNDVKGETYIDSLKDLANYAILTLIEIYFSKK